jgi:FAD/FMN-containing dehydrogenase
LSDCSFQVTIGGVNGPICHGAGIAHKTLSDYVRRIEYVDCNGKLQMVDDPNQIKAAAGAFGLLGVVTHITFELDAMTYAVMVRPPSWIEVQTDHE